MNEFAEAALDAEFGLPPEPFNCRCTFIARQAMEAGWEAGTAMLMRRTADIEPDLIRNAEIRALTEPS